MFKAVHICYKTAPIQVREQAAIAPSAYVALLEMLKSYLDLSEVLVLSTCNRTEIYYCAEQDLSAEILKILAIFKNFSDANAFAAYARSIDDQLLAATHLFRVALGLESQVLGDMQIINQIKQAYQACADSGLAGPFLHRLLHSIFFANKKVSQETAFRSGAASVSYVAAEMAQELIQDLPNPSLLILGAGEMGADVAKNIAAQRANYANLTLQVCNRTQSKAEELALECNCESITFQDRDAAIAKADLVISTIPGFGQPDDYLIKYADTAQLDGFKYRFFIDLSVPRSIDPQIEQLPFAIVYNIDQINVRVSGALDIRRQAIGQVEAIMDQALADFFVWCSESMVSPVIHKLKNALEQIRQEELARYARGLTEHETNLIDKITGNMIQKIIKLPVLQLKAACKRGDADAMIELVNDLFDLEKQSQNQAESK